MQPGLQGKQLSVEERVRLEAEADEAAQQLLAELAIEESKKAGKAAKKKGARALLLNMPCRAVYGKEGAVRWAHCGQWCLGTCN
jgi:hypothetical protein